MGTNAWFEVSKEGLEKLIAQRGKGFIVNELVQNAWDEDITRVDVTLAMPLGSRSKAHLTVKDDSPNGFQQISHAFTFFAESLKKDDPTKRGRFNQGEKLVLALCESATIISTQAAVQFKADGTRVNMRDRLSQGTEFQAVVRMTQRDIDDIANAVQQLIPPPNIITTFNGEPVIQRDAVHEFTTTLPTIISNAEGELTRTARQTRVELYRPLTGETPHLYEMGIPVVPLEGGEPYHVNVMQKVLLNHERDNVTPAYLREIRTAVLNNTYDLIKDEEAKGLWVNHALEDDDVSSDAVRAIIKERFGDKVVAFDPSDLEANARAMGAGYTVIPGATFSKAAWSHIRDTEAAPGAGKTFPTPAPHNGQAAEAIPVDKWTPDMLAVANLAQRLARELMGIDIAIYIMRDYNATASYAPGELFFNLKRLGHGFFRESNLPNILKLLLHELGHHGNKHHLSDEYHENLTSLGAKAIMLALRQPDFFKYITAATPELVGV